MSLKNGIQMNDGTTQLHRHQLQTCQIATKQDNGKRTSRQRQGDVRTMSERCQGDVSKAYWDADERTHGWATQTRGDALKHFIRQCLCPSVSVSLSLYLSLSLFIFLLVSFDACNLRRIPREILHSGEEDPCGDYNPSTPVERRLMETLPKDKPSLNSTSSSGNVFLTRSIKMLIEYPETIRRWFCWSLTSPRWRRWRRRRRIFRRNIANEAERGQCTEACILKWEIGLK